MMDNKELEIKIKEIINKSNYFDMVLAAKTFEKEYKDSSFYKETKKPLSEVIKETKIFYILELDDVFKKIQTKINELNFDNVTNIINEFGKMFQEENLQSLGDIEELKKLIAELK